MTAVTFDTLKLARRLEGAGFTRAQADGAAEALADSLSNEIATKTDIAGVRTEIAGVRTEIVGLRAEMTEMRAELRSELRTSSATLDARLSTEIASVRSSTAQWIITAVFINTAGLIGAVATVWQLAHK